MSKKGGKNSAFKKANRIDESSFTRKKSRRDRG